VGLGTDGLVNIEREAKLSGSTHDKGVLILAGFLRNTYGRRSPVTLSASICFEQNYGGVDGDSASSAELFALLSNLAEVPLRQDIAVTGSVNQWGQIQAIGAVNEKIEGFYDVCRQIGLTGEQGVCIPQSNVRNLVLRDDVRQAVAEGRFHIYPIHTIDEGLELLTGFKAGLSEVSDSLHGRVADRLRIMSDAVRGYGRDHETRVVPAGPPESPPPGPPKIPGDQP
jgi:ATP-dependent Lon protease